MYPLDNHEPGGALQGALLRLDLMLWRLGGVFIWICNICMLGMLTLTGVTILARPFGWSAYWMWPWTMVFFVWLSFFGFFAIYVRLRDIRVDFFAQRMGPFGMAATRLISDLSALAICGTLLGLMPTVIATSRGYVDGAIFPDGGELARQMLSVPLFISTFLICLVALVDLAKMAAGLPENVNSHHPEA
ncbi:TRAP transporter small permease subunit [Labrenzia sp. OB1]|uniref:TRAP transporter small permease n=1 Tax=Labrenzia sp. OB1 TaxID=1561204 RepID=UPI0007B26507|nr:TRAP transporter small permease subunit [Labrenzia sp. OB1]KZM48221.1 TRAP transporter [Labrenzia sp. OB1]